MDILLAFTPNGASASPSASTTQDAATDPSLQSSKSFAEQLDAVRSPASPSDTVSEALSESKRNHRNSADNPPDSLHTDPQHTDPQHNLVPDIHYPVLPADVSIAPSAYTGLVVSGLATATAEAFSREALTNQPLTHEPISDETLPNQRLMLPGQDARPLDQAGERLAQMIEVRQGHRGATTSSIAFPASPDLPLARSLSSSPDSIVQALSSDPAALALTGREEQARHQALNDRQQPVEAVEGRGLAYPAHFDNRMPTALPDSMTRTEYAGGLGNKETVSTTPIVNSHDSGLTPVGSSMTSSSARLPGAPGPGTFQASIALPVNDPAWPGQLSSTLARFSQTKSTVEGDHRVELRLHPAELGPLSINLRLGEHGAQAQFFSAHPQVRHAVEQAIPQLREALAEQGIQLGETSVGSQGFAQPQNEASHSSTSDRMSETEDLQITSMIEVPQGASTRASRMDGRIDLYA